MSDIFVPDGPGAHTYVEAVAYDADRNGVYESVHRDTNYDGKFETKRPYRTRTHHADGRRYDAACDSYGGTLMTDGVTTARRVPAPFGRAATVTGIGLGFVVAALPFADIRFHGLLRELAGTGGTFRWNVDDAWMGLFTVVVVGVVVLAAVVRRPMVMGWAALPAAVVVGWALLTFSDIQLGSSFVSDEIGTRVNEDRSLGPGAWLKVLGMLLVVVGLAVPLFERWRARSAPAAP
jgi:hypothetical protein